MPEDKEMMHELGEPKGLPQRHASKESRSGHTKPVEAPEVVTAASPPSRERKKARKPGDTETIFDEKTGQTWTFTLPNASEYARLMGRRFMRVGTVFSLVKTPRLRTLMQEYVSPKPDFSQMLEGDEDWLTNQFWAFLNRDTSLNPEEDAKLFEHLNKPVKVHEQVQVRSSVTGNVYVFFMPSAAEVRRLLPNKEDRIDLDTGETLIDLSENDVLLAQYMDPPLTEENKANMIPRELEWLEFAFYLFRIKRSERNSA